MVETEELIEAPRVRSHDVHVRGSEFFEVVHELVGAWAAHLTGGEVRGVARECGDLCGFTARRGAHVKDVGAGTRPHQQRR